METKLLYTVPEVAEILGINEDSVHKLRKSGLLPVIKIGHYKIRHEALVQFLRDYEGKDVTDPNNVKWIQ